MMQTRREKVYLPRELRVRMKRTQAIVIAGLLLLTLIFPQLALADEPGYSLSLSPYWGYCDDQIGVTATVAAAGTYHICWDSRSAANVVETFTATGAGSYALTFYIPDANKGIHTVYLVDTAYAEKAKADFEVFPSVKIDPEEGPIHTEVTINCYGFASSQDVQVKFRDIVIRTAKANTVGSLATYYTIPPTPSGLYTFEIEAKEGTEWVSSVSKYFRVTATQCFIATAAYGIPMAEEIQILREFRDEYLLTNPLGQVFVDFYYKVSPPVAEFITGHPSLKPIVRAGLVPVVAMSTVVVNTTMAEKIVMIGLLVLVSVTVVMWTKKRPSRGSEYT